MGDAIFVSRAAEDPVETSKLAGRWVGSVYEAPREPSVTRCVERDAT